MRINKVQKREIFEKIASSLIKNNLAEYLIRLDEVANSIYNLKYLDLLPNMNKLPDNFFSFDDSITLDGFNMFCFYPDMIGFSYYGKRKMNNNNNDWYNSKTHNIPMFKTKKMRCCDYSVTISYKDVPLDIKTNIDAVFKIGAKIYKTFEKIFDELYCLINSCKTLKQLSDVLPEYKEYFPHFEKHTQIMVIPNNSSFKNALKKI